MTFVPTLNFNGSDGERLTSLTLINNLGNIMAIIVLAEYNIVFAYNLLKTIEK